VLLRTMLGLASALLRRWDLALRKSQTTSAERAGRRSQQLMTKPRQATQSHGRENFA
jgi:hypothetical protein